VLSPVATSLQVDGVVISRRVQCDGWPNSRTMLSHQLLRHTSVSNVQRSHQSWPRVDTHTWVAYTQRTSSSHSSSSSSLATVVGYLKTPFIFVMIGVDSQLRAPFPVYTHAIVRSVPGCAPALIRCANRVPLRTSWTPTVSGTSLLIALNLFDYTGLDVCLIQNTHPRFDDHFGIWFHGFPFLAA